MLLEGAGSSWRCIILVVPQPELPLFPMPICGGEAVHDCIALNNLNERLALDANHVREKANTLPAGAERDDLLKKAVLLRGHPANDPFHEPQHSPSGSRSR